MPNFDAIQICLPKFIKHFNLNGIPESLGNGQFGQAFRFNDKVLKITHDDQEASTCAKLIGHNHPNVYHIHGVAETTFEENISIFGIVYDYLEKVDDFNAQEIIEFFSNCNLNYDIKDVFEHWVGGRNLIKHVSNNREYYENFADIMYKHKEKDDYDISLAILFDCLYDPDDDFDSKIQLVIYGPDYQYNMFQHIDQIVEGARFVHKITGHWVIDIHIDNVMMSNDGELVLIDLGRMGTKKENIPLIESITLKNYLSELFTPALQRI
jgi:hypothetical protein